MIYEWIGRAVVKAAKYFVVTRYGRQLQIAAGVLAVAVGIGAYLLSRDVREG
jgi:hypothetical protein